MGQTESADAAQSWGDESIVVMVHVGENHNTYATCQLQFGRNTKQSPPSQEQYQRLFALLDEFLNRVRDGNIDRPMMAVVAGKIMDGNFVELSKHDQLKLHGSELSRHIERRAGSTTSSNSFLLQWKVPLHQDCRKRFAVIIFNFCKSYDVRAFMPFDASNVTGHILSEYIGLHGSGEDPPVVDGRDKPGIYIIGGLVSETDPRYPEGTYQYPSKSTSYYDDDKHRIEEGPNLTVGRYAHVAARMPNGNIVVAGGAHEINGIADIGVPAYENLSDDAADEIVTVPTLTCEFLASRRTGFNMMRARLTVARLYAACAVTNKGTLIVCGGTSDVDRDSTVFHKTIEMLDYDADRFVRLNTFMKIARMKHTATAISDNEIIVCGGQIAERGQSVATNTTEIINIETGQAMMSVPMKIPRDSHSATLLSDGTVFICGQGSAEILDLRRRTSTQVDLFDAKAPLPIHSIAARLRSGDVLFVEGGRDSLLGPQPETQIYIEDKKDFLYGTTIHKHRASFAMTSF